MKHNLIRPLVNFKGEPFLREVPNPDGTHLNLQVPLTLKDLLEQACVNASPQKYSTGDKKMEVYALLKKVSAANPFAQLTAEDVALLKTLVGDAASVVAVGAVFELLENPLTSVPNEDRPNRPMVEAG